MFALFSGHKSIFQLLYSPISKDIVWTLYVYIETIYEQV